MQLKYFTVDVFTQRQFGGNQLAVLLDADPLTTVQMQRVASEFNYSETTFVCRPENGAHDAQVRIFTPTVEVPFAGHPNVGTAFVMASSDDRWRNKNVLLLEETAGLVKVDVTRHAGHVSNTQLTAPESLSVGTHFDAQAIAACLGLTPTDICVDNHGPVVASIGLPFVVVELCSRDALARASADVIQFAELLPVDGADAIYLYSRECAHVDGDVDFTARMFAPSDGLVEDPATGSATGAACALLHSLVPGASVHSEYNVAQGVDMGRPSHLKVEICQETGITQTKVGGSCVAVISGIIEI